MAKAQIILGELGGGGGYVASFTIAQMQSATDSNPIIISGDFSNVKNIFGAGIYNGAQIGTLSPSYVSSITLGVTNKVEIATYSPYTAYRNVTVYSDKVVIGSGFYDNTEGSNYGILLTLALNCEKIGE